MDIYVLIIKFERARIKMKWMSHEWSGVDRWLIVSDREGWLRMGFHIELLWRPQSKFIVEACWRMCNASVTHLSYVYGANATTLAESQSTLCSLFHACTAMSFFTSCLRTAYLFHYSFLQGSASFTQCTQPHSLHVQFCRPHLSFCQWLCAGPSPELVTVLG